VKKQPYRQPFLTPHRPLRALATKVAGECALLLVLAEGPASGSHATLSPPPAIAPAANQTIRITPLSAGPQEFAPLKAAPATTGTNIKRPGEKTAETSGAKVGEKTIGEKTGDKQPSEKTGEKTTDKSPTEKITDKDPSEKDKETEKNPLEKSPAEVNPSGSLDF